VIGLAFGTMRGARRGMGSDIAGSRPYRRGDLLDKIAWGASARLSSARASDEFIVREHYADEAPYVVAVCDRRPGMFGFAPPLPWLEKHVAMRVAVELILQSALEARGFVGYLDFADSEPFWKPPQSERGLFEVTRRLDGNGFAAPEDNLSLALAHLEQHRRALPTGSFAFVLSDFLTSPSEHAWWGALEYFWDIVPVVIQDPIWEQSFPDVSGIVVPFFDPAAGRVTHVRLSAGEAAERKAENEERLHRLVVSFRELGLDPILISSSERGDVLLSFLEWSEERRAREGRGW